MLRLVELPPTKQLYVVSSVGQSLVSCVSSLLSEPTPPSFSITDVRDTWVNVSWVPSYSGNPGSIFYIQYRPRGEHRCMAWVTEGGRGQGMV